MNKYVQKGLRETMKVRMIRNSLIGLYNVFVKNPEIESRSTSKFNHLDVEKAINELNEDALTNTFKINEDALNNLLEDCRKELVFPNLKFDGTEIIGAEGEVMDLKNPKSFQKDCIWFKYKNIEQWDSLKEIKYDPKLLDVVKGYLGNNPIVRNEYLWWSFPAITEKDDEFDSPRYWFHYDIDDLKFIKIFIYLNDVDKETGPHIVVKNTHKSKSFKYKRNRRIESNKLKGFFEDKEIVELTGEKGTCFLEDTFTYHNGTPPKKPRLVLQIEYSLTNLKLG